jgi:hypothetical protein
MPPDLPGLSGGCAPLRLKFGSPIELRRNLDHFLGVVERLPCRLAGDPLE